MHFFILNIKINNLASVKTANNKNITNTVLLYRLHTLSW